MPSQHSDTIVLRAAAASDVEAIVALENSSFSHSGERFEERRVQRIVADGRFTVLVAELRGQLLGWAAGFVWLRGKLPWGRVYAIAVDPRARGRRLGHRLMENVVGALEARGAARLFLEVRAENVAALRLYAKLGFSECRRLPNYYGPGIAAVRMVRLTPSSPAASP